MGSAGRVFAAAAIRPRLCSIDCLVELSLRWLIRLRHRTELLHPPKHVGVVRVVANLNTRLNI
jgi:hypothetical protein